MGIVWQADENNAFIFAIPLNPAFA